MTALERIQKLARETAERLGLARSAAPLIRLTDALLFARGHDPNEADSEAAHACFADIVADPDVLLLAGIWGDDSLRSSVLIDTIRRRDP